MPNDRKQPRIPLLEWISAGTGLVITIALFGYLAAGALAEPNDRPPLLQLTPSALYRSGDSYVLEVKVTNESSRTGASVQVEGIILDGALEIQRSSATLSYVPGESHRKAGLVFNRDPRGRVLRLRVTGFELP